MKKIFIHSEYITLGQLLKLVGLISNGSDAKFFLINNKVWVDDILEERRGKKIYNNMKIKVNNVIYLIQRKEQDEK